MRRLRCQLVAALMMAQSAALWAADPPIVPKDTLPKKLSIDEIPYGLAPNRPVPADNPMTQAKVELGRRLFFDPSLSVDGTVACASCHDPARGFAGREATSVGVAGRRGTRNAPSLLNRAYGTAFFWDGRAGSLEEQAFQPLVSSLEMANPSHHRMIGRLRADALYHEKFQAVFPDGVTAPNLAKAIASFERTLLVGDSPVDRFHAADFSALSDSERQGLWLFTSRGRCWRCHSGHNFTDEKVHNTGVSWAKEPIDLGRYTVTKRDTDRGAFKTPGLRGVADTAPYMHDGSLATLEEVVGFYSRGGVKNPYLDPIIEPLNLSKDEIRYLSDFLKALSPARRDSSR